MFDCILLVGLVGLSIFAIAEIVFFIRDIIRFRRNKSLTKKSELKGDSVK